MIGNHSNAQRPSRGTVLIISQVFVPDPAAVGQYLSDVAGGLVEKGLRVKVLAANRGYDDPGVVYQRRSNIDGIEVRRVGLSSFGKKNLLLRILAQMSFVLQSIVRGLFTPGLRSILISTSPPMGGLAALIVGTIRRVPITYWVMDINPDQAIAAGQVKPGSILARVLDVMNRSLLGRARVVITLDDHMADRLRAKGPIGGKLFVIPPWPLGMLSEAGPPGKNDFRATHNPDDRFVVMYSGNHSLTHPLKTILDAALRLNDQDDLRFLFVGGGLGKREVDDLIEKHHPNNITSLPYQPLEELGEVLSAGDVHVATMGHYMVGLVHPSKVYGAMAAGRLILYVGPPSSHITDLIDGFGIGWQFRHGDVDGIVSLLRELPTRDDRELAEMGQQARIAADEHFSRANLRNRVVSLISRDRSRDQNP